jgi:hypothetical protein
LKTKHGTVTPARQSRAAAAFSFHPTNDRQSTVKHYDLFCDDQSRRKQKGSIQLHGRSRDPRFDDHTCREHPIESKLPSGKQNKKGEIENSNSNVNPSHIAKQTSRKTPPTNLPLRLDRNDSIATAILG